MLLHSVLLLLRVGITILNLLSCLFVFKLKKIKLNFADNIKSMVISIIILIITLLSFEHSGGGGGYHGGYQNGAVAGFTAPPVHYQQNQHQQQQQPPVSTNAHEVNHPLEQK